MVKEWCGMGWKCAGIDGVLGDDCVFVRAVCEGVGFGMRFAEGGENYEELIAVSSMRPDWPLG
ncbi:hypothetical protein JD969_06255 [Planctomycetota bacterium]|nr:hypothetical protein JD969_06255 [Planctomycetota bacterium]